MWFLLTEGENDTLTQTTLSLGVELQHGQSIPTVRPDTLIAHDRIVDESLRRLLPEWKALGTVSVLLADDNTDEPLLFDYVLPNDALPEQIIRVCLALRQTSMLFDNTERDRKAMIIACMDALGVPSHLLGYQYLLTAVMMILETPYPTRLKMLRDIYPGVAERFGSNSVMVDRAIRHAVETCWNRGDSAVMRTYLGYAREDKKGMPTNGEFLYMLAMRVRLLLGTASWEQTFLQMTASVRKRASTLKASATVL